MPAARPVDGASANAWRCGPDSSPRAPRRPRSNGREIDAYAEAAEREAVNTTTDDKEEGDDMRTGADDSFEARVRAQRWIIKRQFVDVPEDELVAAVYEMCRSLGIATERCDGFGPETEIYHLPSVFLRAQQDARAATVRVKEIWRTAMREFDAYDALEAKQRAERTQRAQTIARRRAAAEPWRRAPAQAKAIARRSSNAIAWHVTTDDYAARRRQATGDRRAPIPQIEEVAHHPDDRPLFME